MSDNKETDKETLTEKLARIMAEILVAPVKKGGDK